MQKQLKQFFTDRPAVNKTAFAKECGMTKTNLYYLIAGTHNPTEETAEKIRVAMKRYGWEG